MLKGLKNLFVYKSLQNTDLDFLKMHRNRRAGIVTGARQVIYRIKVNQIIVKRTEKRTKTGILKGFRKI